MSAQRLSVRLLVLLVILQEGPAHAALIRRTLERHSGGAWKVPRPSLVDALGACHARGELDRRAIERAGRGPRRVLTYSLTLRGRARALAARTTFLTLLTPEPSPRVQGELFETPVLAVASEAASH